MTTREPAGSDVKTEVGKNGVARFGEPLSEAQANAIWDVLVEHAGCLNSGMDRFSFVINQSRKFIHEWRFIGALGFGGKFWRTYGEEWRVSCYPEDETDEKREIVRRTNEALTALRREATSPPTPAETLSKTEQK